MRIADLKDLAKDMRLLAMEIDAQPDDREWTMDEVDALEELRHGALRLAQNIEAAIDSINGQ